MAVAGTGAGIMLWTAFMVLVVIPLYERYCRSERSHRKFARKFPAAHARFEADRVRREARAAAAEAYAAERTARNADGIYTETPGERTWRLAENAKHAARGPGFVSGNFAVDPDASGRDAISAGNC
jgi:hypothetical protein